MDEQTLGAWVRGELDAERRREVSRWLVRCTDPAIGDLLHGLVREAEESPLDRALAAMGQRWAALVEAWRALVAADRAVWSDAAGPAVVIADVGGSLNAALAVEASESSYALSVAGPPHQEVRVFLTADDARADLVGSGQLDADGAWRGDVARIDAARPTLWAVVTAAEVAAEVANLAPDAQLVALVHRPDVQVHAWRDVGGAE
jgi:hypothetical protein